MKQIKTIKDENTTYIDLHTNEALTEGWRLMRRYYTRDGFFVVELEREIITKAERCCDNCRHCDKAIAQEPCCSCSEDADKWEPMDDENPDAWVEGAGI